MLGTSVSVHLWQREHSCTARFLCIQIWKGAAIENLASCEVAASDIFLLVKYLKPIEIHQGLCEVYGNNIKTESFAFFFYLFISELIHIACISHTP